MKYFPQRIEVFWHLFEMHCVAPNFPGVSAAPPGYCLTSLRDEP